MKKISKLGDNHYTEFKKKTLKDLTPEIIAKIPEYQARAIEGVFDGGRYENFDIEKAKAAIKWNYEKCGFKMPTVLVVENPLEQQLLFNFLKINKEKYALILYILNNEFVEVEFFNIKCKISSYFLLFFNFNKQDINIQLDSQLNNQFFNQLNNQLNLQLNSQVINQLDYQLIHQLRNQLYNQLDNQLTNQIDELPYDQLHGLLNDHFLNQLDSQLGDQLNKQLSNQLNEQLRNYLCNQLDNKLGNQLDLQLDSQLIRQIRTQLDCQFDDKFRDLLYTQLDSQLTNQLNDLLCNQIDNQINLQLDNLISNQIHNQLIKFESQFYIKFDNQLIKFDNQFSNLKELYNYNSNYLYTLNVYSDCYYTWFKFIKDEFNIPLSIEDDFEECFKLQRESGIYSCIVSESVAIVCKYPKKVNQEKSGNFNLHDTKGNAVQWGSLTGVDMDCYYVNGRNLSRELFEKTVNKTLTFEEFQKLENEDEKACIITIIKENEGNQGILNFLGAVEVDNQKIVHANGYIETQKLYKTKQKFKWANDSQGKSNVPLAWNAMICPSTGQTYLIETCPSFTNVIESAKWLRPNFVPQNLEYLWQSAN